MKSWHIRSCVKKNFITSWWNFSKGNIPKDAPWARLQHIKNSAWDLLLWYHIRPRHWNLMTVIAHLFFQIWFLSHKKWHSKNNRNRLFCREKYSLSSETFLASNHQTMTEKIAKYDKDWKISIFRTLKKYDPCHFLIDQSEWVHIWVFIVTFYELSNGRIKFKI
jgi:hypothetical protein